MKRILNNILVIIVLLIIFIQIITNSNSTMSVIKFGFDIWKNNVFPSLFPFFVLSNILINYDFVSILAKLFGKFSNKLFKINTTSTFIFFMSILSGFPSSAKYTKDLLDKKLITIDDANKILLFSHFSNPLFIIGTISISFLNNKKVGLLILIIHYLTNIIIGLIFRNFYSKQYIKNNEKIKNILNKEHHFGLILSNSITSSINTLLMILGTICTFLILTNVINNMIHLDDFNMSLLNGIIEMTQGLKYVSLLDISMKIKAILMVMIISFGGLCIHMQEINILGDYKINYFIYLIARIMHAGIAGILMYIIYDLVI